jgi:S1-C subfamily serine protease
MKKVALYSSSSRSRKAGAGDADGPGAPPAADASGDAGAPASAAPPGRLRRFYARFERPLLVVGGALFAVALVVTYAKSRPGAQELTQQDIDAAVLHTLENNRLPSFASKAFAAIQPSVVRVIGLGPEGDDDDALPGEQDNEKGGGKAKGADAGKGDPAARAKDKDAAKEAAKSRDRVFRSDGGKDKPSDGAKGKDKSADKSADKGKDGKDGKRSPHGGTGVGTGVVIVDKGIILTNLHVVIGAERIKVRFFDGMESEATVIGVRPEHDLAVLQAKSVPDDLVAATLRSTADLAIGDEVVAVGFPFGIGPSASAGVVSGLKREYHSKEGKRILTNLIQFDAAANPGNSGGPLVTADGEVVGIVTGILNPTTQRVFIGIGFAVPIENAAAAVGMSPF